MLVWAIISIESGLNSLREERGPISRHGTGIAGVASEWSRVSSVQYKSVIALLDITDTARNWLKGEF